MKKVLQKSMLLLIAIFSFGLTSLFAQIPQAINFQAIARDAESNPMINANIQIRLSVVDETPEGTVVYQELRALQTNDYGSFSFQIGRDANFITVGTFEEIEWETCSKFLKIDYDPTNTFSFDLTLGIIEFVSIPYAFAAETVVFIDATGAENGDVLLYNQATGKFEPGTVTAGSITWDNVQDKPDFSNYDSDVTDDFSGDYEDLVNTPTIPTAADGSETKIQAGTNVTVAGTGTSANPYVINSFKPTTIEITSSQTYTVPQGASKIRVELWGGAGGGGGVGMYSYSLNYGGTGGSGGYIQQEIIVSPDDQFNIIIGAGGMHGNNASGYSNGFSIGDTDGTNGGDTWFGSFKAAGGTGGKRGGFSTQTVNGSSGINNIGSISAYSSVSGSNILDIFQGLNRSYFFDRSFTSKPGDGGQYIELYSMYYDPESGENGAAVITIF